MHQPIDCHDVTCAPCLDHSRRESVVRLELALLELECCPAGAEGMWADLDLLVDAIDVRNVLDLLRGA